MAREERAFNLWFRSWEFTVLFLLQGSKLAWHLFSCCSFGPRELWDIIYSKEGKGVIEYLTVCRFWARGTKTQQWVKSALLPRPLQASGGCWPEDGEMQQAVLGGHRQYAEGTEKPWREELPTAARGKAFIIKMTCFNCRNQRICLSGESFLRFTHTYVGTEPWYLYFLQTSPTRMALYFGLVFCGLHGRVRSKSFLIDYLRSLKYRIKLFIVTWVTAAKFWKQPRRPLWGEWGETRWDYGLYRRRDRTGNHLVR